MKLLRGLGIFCSMLLLTTMGWAQSAPMHWDEDGVRIRQGYHIEWQRNAEIDEDGNVIYAWSDTRYGDRAVFVQKVSPDGTVLWDDDGVLINDDIGRQEDPSIMPVGSGNTIIIWNDFRVDIEKGDMYAQKIDADGNLQWDPDGVLVTTGDFDSPAVFRIVSDGIGGAVILWNDLRNGDEGDIYAAHLLSDGSLDSNPNWTANGLAVSVEPAGQRELTVDTDGAGGAIIGWMDNFVGSNRDIYIQRVTIDGTLAWGADGVVVCSAPLNQTKPKLCPDGSGGAFIVWNDKRTDSNGDLYFHHITSNGTLNFPEANGKVLYSDPAELRSQIEARIVADGLGNAIVIWMDSRNDPMGLIYDIYSQKVDSDGNLQWDAAGEPVCIEGSGQLEARVNGTGDGRAVAVWMDERDGNETPFCNIYAQMINADGSMAWTSDGVAVCEANDYQKWPLMRSTADFSMVAWSDERTGSPGIYYQRLNNSNGAPSLTVDGDILIWGLSGNGERLELLKSESGKIFIFYQDSRGLGGYAATVQVIDTLGNTYLIRDGMMICPDPEFTYNKSQERISACSDGDHGAIAVWEDHRDSNNGAKIYAQRVSEDGTLHWGDAGVLVSDYTLDQNQPQIVSDGDGGGIIAWSELNPAYDNKVAAARIDHDGNTLWSIIVADIAVQDDILQDIVPDGNGGAYISYYHLDPMQFQNYNLYAQHVDANGNLLWSTATICDAPSIQLYCQGASLEEDGVVFVWEDSRNGTSDIYAQRFSFDGDTLWDVNGIVINDDINDQTGPEIVLDNQDNFYVTWEDFRDSVDIDIFIQKVDLNGQLLFQEDGMEVCTASNTQSLPRIISDGAYGSLVVWVDFRQSGAFSDIFGIHLDENGEPSDETIPGWGDTWTANGNIVNESYQKQENHQIIDDYADGTVVVWEDRRSSGKEEVVNVYAQRINGVVVGVEPDQNGTTQPHSFALHQPYPNPFNPEVVISYALPTPEHVRVTVYDIQGRLIETLRDGWTEAGDRQLRWNAKNMASGLYLVKLEIADFVAQQKMILLK